MDDLIKQRQEFMKKAINSTEVFSQMKRNREAITLSNSTTEPRKKKKKTGENAQIGKELDYKKVESAANATNFGYMAKIVDYMKKRFLNQQPWSLSLREIFEEMQNYDVPKKTEMWLREALPQNPRLQMEENGNFNYRPPIKIKGGQMGILNILKKNHADQKGGVLLSVLNDCLPSAEVLVRSLGTKVVDIQTQVNKRKDRVFFYNDPEIDLEIDEEFVKLWRTANVEHLDEKKIEEYLQKHGFQTNKDLVSQKFAHGVPKRKATKRKTNQKVHNQHLSDVLQDFDE